MNYISDLTSSMAKGMALRVEQKIQICLKPKPKLIPKKVWLKLASLFIYIEKTEPSITLTSPKTNLTREEK